MANSLTLNTLREIGWSTWNPIGLPGPPETPADEYDMYLLEAMRQLERRECLRDVADYLIRIEQKQMGMGVMPFAADRALATAQALEAVRRGAKTR